MSIISRLRQSLTSSNPITHHHFFFTSILSQNSTTPRPAKSKTQYVISLLKSEQNPHKILDICRAASHTPDTHLHRIAFSVAITRLSKSNYFDIIRQFLNDLLTSRPDLKTERFAAHAIVLYGQANMVSQAVDTFEQIDDLGIRRSVESLNALLFACLLGKDYKELNRVYLEFPKIYGIEPNLDTFNTVIKGFSESNSTSSGYSVLAEMERKSVKPNATSFGNMLAGFYKEGRFEDVGKVLNLMEKHGVNMRAGFYKKGRFEVVGKVWNWMEKQGVSIISLLKSEQNPHKILDICRAASLTPDTHLHRIAFPLAITRLSKSNHFDIIRQFLNDLLTSRPDLKTERFAAHAIVLHGQANMVSQAVDTFERIDDLGIRRSVESLNALLFACLLGKDYKELNRVYLEFPKIYGIEPNLDTFNTVIKGFSESNSTSSGYSVLAEMERKSVKPNATSFGNMLAGFYKEGRFEDVGKVRNLMEKHGVSVISFLKSEQNPHKILDICRAASLTPDTHLDRIAFSIAITRLSKSNHFDIIRQFLNDLLTSRPDLKTERFAAHAIVLYGQANMVSQAVDTFERIDDLGIRRSVESLNALLFACLLGKDYKELNRVYLEFPKIYGIEPNLDTFNTVIKGFSESNSTSSGYSVLAEMERKSVKPNATSFGNMLAGFYKEERFEDVGKVLNLMEKHGVNRAIGTYNIRMQSLCKLKMSSEHKAMRDALLLRGMKLNLHLIYGFCKEGKLEEAKKLFKSMAGRGFKPDSNCYYTLVHFLRQGKDFEAALLIANEGMEKLWAPNFSTMKLIV